MAFQGCRSLVILFIDGLEGGYRAELQPICLGLQRLGFNCLASRDEV